MEEGFRIDGLTDLQETLERHKQQLPEVLSHILESLGYVLLDKAQDVLKNTYRPHSRFTMRSTIATRGRNKSKARNYIQYIGNTGASSVDTGELWTSLERGGKDNIWVANVSAGVFRLVVGSGKEHASYINRGYDRRRHWVPGRVDSNGIFRYQKGAKTGIMVSSGHFVGVHYFDIAFEEVKKLMPTVAEYELRRFFYELGVR